MRCRLLSAKFLRPRLELQTESIEAVKLNHIDRCASLLTMSSMCLQASSQIGDANGLAPLNARGSLLKPLGTGSTRTV